MTYLLFQTCHRGRDCVECRWFIRACWFGIALVVILPLVLGILYGLATS